MANASLPRASASVHAERQATQHTSYCTCFIHATSPCLNTNAALQARTAAQGLTSTHGQHCTRGLCALAVPWRLYQFPEFPWPRHMQPSIDYPTGQEVQAYVKWVQRMHTHASCMILFPQIHGQGLVRVLGVHGRTRMCPPRYLGAMVVGSTLTWGAYGKLRGLVECAGAEVPGARGVGERPAGLQRGPTCGPSHATVAPVCIPAR